MPTSEIPHARLEKLDSYTRRIALALAHGHHTHALRIVQEHALLASEGVGRHDTRTHLSECDLPTKVLNALASIGVETIGDLSSVAHERLAGMPNIGQRTVVETLQTVLNLLAPRH